MRVGTMHPPPSPHLVTDFDNTMVMADFYDLLFEHLVDPALICHWQEYEDGRRTHFEALDLIFRSIRTDEAGLLHVLQLVRVHERLAASVHALQDAGWTISVASAGCTWYIERLLAGAGITVDVHANPGRFEHGAGLVMELPRDSPFFDAGTGISKAAVVRHALAHHDVVAFAGDGRPDYEAALLVPPARRFARGWLAEKLTADGIAFQRFETWPEVADALLTNANV
ncbi:MAG: hypothetical protein PWP23_2441 [Candidatus Sumerlaeota bacterium]|nr:hypothetical protein [Candidatus Sumerlaeota bacterium]